MCGVGELLLTYYTDHTGIYRLLIGIEKITYRVFMYAEPLYCYISYFCCTSTWSHTGNYYVPHFEALQVAPSTGCKVK